MKTHILCLGDQTLHGNTSEFSAKLRDNTVSTVLVTAFGNLQVTAVSAGCHDTLNIHFRHGLKIIKLFDFLTF